uniref:Uncharacterized protein n=1 Tax=Oryza sativa subsp. japonica TaxID=39947 RepID=Q7XIH9_ORYSJ|nr:hypothetical protein [Oryza sativa Japonica Group]
MTSRLVPDATRTRPRLDGHSPFPGGVRGGRELMPIEGICRQVEAGCFAHCHIVLCKGEPSRSPFRPVTSGLHAHDQERSVCAVLPHAGCRVVSWELGKLWDGQFAM